MMVQAFVIDSRFISFWRATEVIVKRNQCGMLVIKDNKGRLLFNIKSSDTIVHRQLLLLDKNATVIATIRSKIRTAHDRWNVFRGEQCDANLLFSASRNRIIQGHTHVNVSLQAHSDDRDFKIDGSWSNKTCVVSDCRSSETIIARMRPGDSPDEFRVKIQAGEDPAFVVALIATIDAMKTPVAKRAGAVGKEAFAVGKELAVDVAAVIARVAPLIVLVI